MVYSRLLISETADADFRASAATYGFDFIVEFGSAIKTHGPSSPFLSLGRAEQARPVAKISKACFSLRCAEARW